MYHHDNLNTSFMDMKSLELMLSLQVKLAYGVFLSSSGRFATNVRVRSRQH